MKFNEIYEEFKYRNVLLEDIEIDEGLFDGIFKPQQKALVMRFKEILNILYSHLSPNDKKKKLKEGLAQVSAHKQKMKNLIEFLDSRSKYKYKDKDVIGSFETLINIKIGEFTKGKQNEYSEEQSYIANKINDILFTVP